VPDRRPANHQVECRRYAGARYADDEGNDSHAENGLHTRHEDEGRGADDYGEYKQPKSAKALSQRGEGEAD